MIPIYDLEFGWFTIFVILIIGYAILDGFDLGVGMLHLFAKNDQERRIMLNSIGPVWDGNEVWLVTAGGALFAGFPDIYATMLSAFYMPVMMLLFGLILRAVAIEFRSKQPMKWWRWTWDIIFFLGSILISFILGMTVGNLIRGIPLDANKEFIGTIGTIFHPYACLVGLLTLSLFAMHGSIYILMKTEGEFHAKMRSRTNPCIIFFIIMYAVTTMATLIYMPHMIQTFHDRPVFFAIAILNILLVANIPREIYHGHDARAFASSCLNIVCLLVLYAIGTYPNVIRSIDDPHHLSLTIYNSASSKFTLEILFIIAVIGIPLVVVYTMAVYYIFHGKVKIDPHSY
jgi:cytochrome d ubiquinol oxidase subunit II